MGKITIEVKINTFGKMKHPNSDVGFICGDMGVHYFIFMVGEMVMLQQTLAINNKH